MDKAYQEICQDSKAFNETNDCTVIATSIACGISYADAHALLTAKGRKQGRGIRASIYHAAIREQGFQVIAIRNNRKLPATVCQIEAKTVRTVEAELAANWGGYRILINTRGHVLSWDGSQIVDWTAGRIHRITDAFLILPADAPIPDRGNSVPVPERKKLNRGTWKVSAVRACIKGNPLQEFKSVKAAYEGLGLDLRGHQKIRQIVKRYGHWEFGTLIRNSENGMWTHRQVYMELVKSNTDEAS